MNDDNGAMGNVATFAPFLRTLQDDVGGGFVVSLRNQHNFTTYSGSEIGYNLTDIYSILES